VLFAQPTQFLLTDAYQLTCDPSLGYALLSAPWAPGDVLVHRVIRASELYVTACLASGTMDKIASSCEIGISKEFDTPWDPDGYTPQAFNDTGLRVSR
jgi:hypothetical protein